MKTASGGAAAPSDGALRAALEKWAARNTPWTGPRDWTGEDGYNAAIEEVVAMLNWTGPDPQDAIFPRVPSQPTPAEGGPQ